MATLFVDKTGNDSTGNGSVGTPYLTVNKAATVCASGDTISINPGIYQENSGSGYLALNRSFASPVTIQSSTGVRTDVTIQSASGTVAEILLSCNNYTLKNLSITSRANTVLIVVRINSTTTNVTFTNCLFTVASNSGQLNVCVSSSFAASTSNGPIAFNTCDFVQTGTNDADAVIITRSASSISVDGITFTNCTSSCYRRGVTLSGVTNFSITNCNFQCISPTNSLHALIIGVDGPQSATTYTTTGTVTNSTFATLNGHAALVGAGVTSCTFAYNRVIGGNSNTSGEGLVLKEGAGIVATDNLIFGGNHSGLYIKGAQGATCKRNVVINLYPNSPCLRVDKNFSDPGATFSAATITDNLFIAMTGTMIAFDPTGAGLGESGTSSVLDRNIYDLRGTATWGQIRGTTLTSWANVLTAWASYGAGTNEQNSALGSTMPSMAYGHSASAGTTLSIPFTGPVLYRLIYDTMGNVWDGSNLVPYVTANHATYLGYLIENPPGSYRFSSKIPIQLPAGDYIVETKLTTGLLATAADTKLQTESVSWDGSTRIKEQYLANASTLIQAIVSN